MRSASAESSGDHARFLLHRRDGVKAARIGCADAAAEAAEWRLAKSRPPL
jgi:hypothetical protein